jgi:hypothetical protein
MCDRDARRMWGVDLCGPTLIVDPKTRAVEGDPLPPANRLPKEIGIANTAVEWGGRRWAMIVAPLPENDFARKTLLAHESFHRVQQSLGFPPHGPANVHLDTVDGRYWLQLEWRALAKALQGDSAALRDALAFRAKRRVLFPIAVKEERELEMHEGLAEYTGEAFAEPRIDLRVPHIVKKLHDAETTPTFVRSFAYATGPAWGTLLERRSPRWTRRVHANDDLPDLTRAAWRIRALPGAEERAALYGGPALLAAERARDAAKQALLRAMRARFIDGPHLTLPLAHMSMQFDPNQSQPFDEYGTVYPTITLRDDWGSLVVKNNGALIGPDFRTVTVGTPAGDDYELTLKEGWVVEGGKVRRKEER